MHGNVMQINHACMLNKQLHDGKIRGDTALLQVIATPGYAHQITQALLIAPLPWGRTRVLAEPFLSPQRHTGWIDQGKGIAQKMARHKECQKLGGSRNADLTATDACNASPQATTKN